MPRTRRPRTKAGLTLALFLSASLPPAETARAGLIRSDATQSFPDLSGDIVGKQTYVYDPSTKTGTFQVSNAPSLLAVGPKSSSEFFVTDEQDAARTQVLQVKLDEKGHLLNDPSNSFAVYGQVVLGGRTYSGLLLQGTPTGFGYAPRNPDAPNSSAYDVNMKLTGGKLLDLYGPDAYLRISAETDGAFDGTFTRDFSGRKAQTSVRADNAPPVVVPEPSTLCVLLACVGAGWLYRRRRAAGVVDLSGDD